MLGCHPYACTLKYIFPHTLCDPEHAFGEAQHADDPSVVLGRARRWLFRNSWECSAKINCEEMPGMSPISWLSNVQTKRVAMVMCRVKVM
jgi:hypothetical protein